LDTVLLLTVNGFKNFLVLMYVEKHIYVLTKHILMLIVNIDEY